MRKLIFSCVFINCASAAIPSMAIPNLVYNKVSLNPGTMYSSDAADAASKPSVDPAKIAKQVKYKLPGFNADVRGAIINSGRFRVVKMANMPDYILLGQVSAISQNEDSMPVKETDRYTTSYNIDIAVDYKLIKTSDKSIMAAFTAYGHANDVKILTNGGAAYQKQTHNIPMLIQTASKALGDDVLSQLSNQFNISSENYANGSKVITDVKIYK
ncbi:MAG TPA: hypothetical protein VKR58_08255 [Aquella sp.]|nr:hypothetical protein [Aquella sp.]